METLYSTEIETRKLPREWRNTICEYADEMCRNKETRNYGYFNMVCSKRGNPCSHKVFFRAVEIFEKFAPDFSEGGF